MSYDISIGCSYCNSNLYEWTYTYNVGPMLHDVGIRLNDMDGMKCEEALPILKEGLEKLRVDPERYKAMSPKDGLGSYDGLVNLLRAVVREVREHPELAFKVS